MGGRHGTPGPIVLCPPLSLLRRPLSPSASAGTGNRARFLLRARALRDAYLAAAFLFRLRAASRSSISQPRVSRWIFPSRRSVG